MARAARGGAAGPAKCIAQGTGAPPLPAATPGTDAAPPLCLPWLPPARVCRLLVCAGVALALPAAALFLGENGILRLGSCCPPGRSGLPLRGTLFCCLSRAWAARLGWCCGGSGLQRVNTARTDACGKRAVPAGRPGLPWVGEEEAEGCGVRSVRALLQPCHGCELWLGKAARPALCEASPVPR